MMDHTEDMLRQALALLETTQQRLSDIEAAQQRIEAQLVPTVPETAYQGDAAKLLGRSDRTLQRWRERGLLKQGLHWWPENGDGAPIYNLLLIRDGQRQGFDSPAHQRACELWLKQQPSNQKRRVG